MSHETAAQITRKKYMKKGIFLNRAMYDQYGLPVTAVFEKLLFEAEIKTKRHQDIDGWFDAPVNEICRYVRLSKKWVINAINTLENEGFIRTKREKFKNTYYYIIPEKWDNYPATNKQKTSGVESSLASGVESSPSSGVFCSDNENFGHQCLPDISEEEKNPLINIPFNIPLNTHTPPPAGEVTQLEEFKIKDKQPNEKQANQPNGGSAAKGKKVKRTTHPGQIKISNSANSGRAATGEILPAPARKNDPLDKYTQEEIEFAHDFYCYAKMEFEPHFRQESKKWKNCRVKWLEGVRKVTRGKNAIITFEELKRAVNYVRNNKKTYFHNNFRTLASLPTKTWGADKDLMILAMLSECNERQQPKQQEKPFDIHNELTILIRHTLAEKYDIRKEYFDRMCTEFEKRLANIWDWLDKLNSKQPSNNKQNWLYGPKCAEKFAEVVRLWNEYGNGIEPVSGVRYAPWGKFWERVKVWQETELQKNEFGIWTITNLANYMGK